MNLTEEIGQCLSRITKPAGVEKDVLMNAIQRLDEIASEYQSELPRDLHHYLQRRSYEKAVLFLEEKGDIPKGTCGGK